MHPQPGPNVPQLTQRVFEQTVSTILKQGGDPEEFMSDFGVDMVRETIQIYDTFRDTTDLSEIIRVAGEHEDKSIYDVLRSGMLENPNPVNSRDAIRHFIRNVDTRWLPLLTPNISLMIPNKGSPPLAVMESDVTLDKHLIVSKIVWYWREELVGKVLNHIIDTAPAFVYTFGSKHCPDTSSEKGGAPCFPKSYSQALPNHGQLLTEYIPGTKTLYKWLMDEHPSEHVKSVFFQLFANLVEAHNRCGFVHGDLHGNNVLVQPLGFSEAGVEVPLNGTMFYMETPFRTRIIDFGFSSVNINGVYFAPAARHLSNYDKVWTDLFRIMVSCSSAGKNQEVLEDIWTSHMGIPESLSEYDIFKENYAIIPPNPFAYCRLRKPADIVSSMASGELAPRMEASENTPSLAYPFEYSALARVAIASQGSRSEEEKNTLEHTYDQMLRRIEDVFPSDASENPTQIAIEVILALEEYGYDETLENMADEYVEISKDQRYALQAMLETLSFLLTQMQDVEGADKREDKLASLKEEFNKQYISPLYGESGPLLDNGSALSTERALSAVRKAFGL